MLVEIDTVTLMITNVLTVFDTMLSPYTVMVPPLIELISGLI